MTGCHLAAVLDSAGSRSLIPANRRPGRLPGPPPCSCSELQPLALTMECKSDLREERQVGMEADALKPANTNLRERVVPFQQPELRFHRDAAAVETPKPLSVAGDAREHSPADRERERWLVRLRSAQRNHRLD